MIPLTFLNYKKQLHLMLLCICSVNKSQKMSNVVRTSVKNSFNDLCATFFFSTF